MRVTCIVIQRTKTLRLPSSRPLLAAKILIIQFTAFPYHQITNLINAHQYYLKLEIGFIFIMHRMSAAASVHSSDSRRQTRRIRISRKINIRLFPSKIIMKTARERSITKPTWRALERPLLAEKLMLSSINRVFNEGWVGSKSYLTRCLAHNCILN